MPFDKLNQWLMLATNLGVIAGIAFLAVEISQNTEAGGRTITRTLSDDVSSM
jgi:hypothetical protein